jgi:NitT/TauT family transport system substrate-binding protein
VDRHLQAFQNGEVDAVVTFEPVRSQLLKAHARELFSSREIPGEIVDVLVVRQGLTSQRKDALCHLLDGYFSALAELRQDPERAAHALAGPEDITPDELVAAWQLMQLPERDEAAAMLQAGQQGLALTLGKLEKVMTANSLLTRDIDEKSLLAPELMAGCTK